MKKYLVSALLIMTTVGAFAAPHTYTATKAKRTTTKSAVKKKTPPPLQREDVQGAIPRAVRGGNPLQMLNPKAPAIYGTAQQHVVVDPDTGKWKGIKLFEFWF